MYSKDKVRRTLISEAISEDGLFLRDMAQKLGISESSLRRELDSMVSFGVLEKRGKEYSVSGDIAAVIIKARCDRGEVIAYSQKEKLILRESVAYSEAQTYESNLLTLCKAADRYKSFLRKKYKNVLCGVIYPSKKGAPYAVRGLFPLCLEERALVCQGLKEALEDYLADSPIDDAYVFHSLRAPYRPMTGSAVYALVDKYFKEANIDTSGKKHGPHSLRASVSTSMINDDVPYEAVRDILGHTSPNSIRRYAKNDIEKLRRCAIPVPAPAGSFRQFLQGGDRG